MLVMFVATGIHTVRGFMVSHVKGMTKTVNRKKKGVKN